MITNGQQRIVIRVEEYQNGIWGNTYNSKYFITSEYEPSEAGTIYQALVAVMHLASSAVCWGYRAGRNDED